MRALGRAAVSRRRIVDGTNRGEYRSPGAQFPGRAAGSVRAADYFRHHPYQYALGSTRGGRMLANLARTEGGAGRRTSYSRNERVLITGMSGVGKSTVAERLSELGYKAVDTDYDGFSEVDERGWQRWDVDRIRKLLATEDVEVLFVVGSDESQGLFSFDHIVLLSAPRDVVVERLASRTNNPFGKRPGEMAKVLADLETFEPTMRRAGYYEIDTSRPLNSVIDEILSLVQQPPPP